MPLSKITISVLILSTINFVSFSQKPDSIKAENYFSGSVAITNNGISPIPTLTLGKPAAIFDLSMGRRLTFEPQFKFALEGKPWSFVLWWRYKLIRNEKFKLTIGAHPAFSFRTITITTDELPGEIIASRRYLAAELSPKYSFGKNVNIGIYYLYAHCLENDATKNTNFLTVNSSISNIRLSKQFLFGINPQFYYLKMDKNDGFYFNSGFSLTKRDFPVSISVLINKRIKSDISAGKDFVWNVSLAYSFNKKFIES